jgi:hypothetical protein
MVNWLLFLFSTCVCLSVSLSLARCHCLARTAVKQNALCDKRLLWWSRNEFVACSVDVCIVDCSSVHCVVTRWYKLTVFEGLVGNAISSLLRVSIVLTAQ